MRTHGAKSSTFHGGKSHERPAQLAERVYCSLCGCWRGALGLEPTPEQYVANMVAVFREVWRVMRPDATLWLNLGDSYATRAGKGANVPQTKWKSNTYPEAAPHRARDIPGLKPKDLCGIPWRVAFALQADGWFLRSDIIWHKPNPMPESVTDRPTKSHEYLFLLTKRGRYYYDADAVRETIKAESEKRYEYPLTGSYTPGSAYPNEKRDRPQQWQMNPAGRNRRTVWTHGEPFREFLDYCISQGVDIDALIDAYLDGQTDAKDVWTIATKPYSGAHFATFPPALVEPCIKAGTSEHGVCGACGGPWERMVEIHDPHGRLGKGYHDHTDDLARGQRGVFPANGAPVKITTGWQPTCSCEAGDPVPALVCDIFCGSGTSLLVARRLGRHAIGLDLSFPYLVDQARKRLELDKLEEWGSGKQAESNLAGLPMFAQDEGG